MLGAEATGKSTIVTRWLRGRSPPEPTPYEPTVEDRFQHEVQLNGRNLTIEVIDTSGADDLADMRLNSIRSGHGFLLVYSVDNAASLAALRRFKAEIAEALGCSSTSSRSRKLHIPMVLVGNKVDQTGSGQRQVSVLDGAAVAKDLFHCKFLEVSGRTGANVNEAFARLLKKMGEHVGSLSKSSSMTSVGRSSSFLGRTIAAVRTKRRPKLQVVHGASSTSSLPSSAQSSTSPTPTSPLCSAPIVLVSGAAEDAPSRQDSFPSSPRTSSSSLNVLPAGTVTSC